MTTHVISFFYHTHYISQMTLPLTRMVYVLTVPTTCVSWWRIRRMPRTHSSSHSTRRTTLYTTHYESMQPVISPSPKLWTHIKSNMKNGYVQCKGCVWKYLTLITTINVWVRACYIYCTFWGSIVSRFCQYIEEMFIFVGKWLHGFSIKRHGCGHTFM